jgi:hypothetical protein
MTGVKVEEVDEQGVIAGGKRIPSATGLWTAGVAASPIAKVFGAKTDRAGRVTVGPCLDVPDAPRRRESTASSHDFYRCCPVGDQATTGFQLGWTDLVMSQ